MEPFLRAKPRHPPKRSQSGPARKGWGRRPKFLFVHDNPISGVDEEML
jgi:hypothetical protein